MIVVADNFCEFIYFLWEHASEPSSGTLDSWFADKISDQIRKIANATQIEYGLNGDSLDIKPNSIQINLSNAKVGSGVSLSFFGELTRLRRNFKSKCISIIKPSELELKKHKREKEQVRLALIGIPLVFFIVFLAKAIFDGTPVLAAIFVIPFMTLIACIGAFFICGTLYSIYQKFFKT